MNPFKKSDDKKIKVVRPNKIGWLEKKLSDKEMEYLWKCIDNRKGSHKSKLAGHIHESNELVDKSNWFWQHTLHPLCKDCLLYTSPSPRDRQKSRMPSSA